MDWSKPTSWGMAVLTAIAMLQIVLVIVWDHGVADAYLWVNYGFAIEIGLLVGATEMISRYRDDPFAPLVSTPGAFYILINGGAAALAYFLMHALRVSLGEPMRTLAAGLGAMAFFRSGLFTVRLGGTDIAVGPNIVLQVILQALDRAYDRQRAVPRSTAVAEIMAGVAFAQVKDVLPTLCFDLMQNVAESEISAITGQIRDLSASPTINDEAKILSLGLALFNIVGEETLRAAVAALGTNIEAFRQVSAQMQIDLATIDPKVATATLPDLCAQLPSGKDDDKGSSYVAALANPGLTPESLAMLTLYRLVAHYGDQRVAAALGILATQATSGSSG